MPLRAPAARAGRDRASLTALRAARILVLGIVVLDCTDIFLAASRAGYSPLALVGAAAQVAAGIAAVVALLWLRVRAAVVALAVLGLLALARHGLVGVELDVLVVGVAVGVATTSRRGAPVVAAGTCLGVALVWVEGDTPSSALVGLALAALGALAGVGIRFLLAAQRGAARWRERENEARALARAQLADDLRAIVDGHLADTEAALASLRPGARVAELRRVLDVAAADSRAALAGLRELLLVLDVVVHQDRPAAQDRPGRRAPSGRPVLRSPDVRLAASAVALVLAVRQGLAGESITGAAGAAVWVAVALALWRPWAGAVLASAAVVAAAIPSSAPGLASLGVGLLWLLTGLTRRPPVAALALLASAAALVAALVHPGAATVAIVVTVATSALGALLGLGLGDYVRAADEAVERRSRLAQGPVPLQDRERRWVAREMHDIVGHELSRVALHALAVDGVDEEASLVEALEGIATTVESTRQALASLLDALADAVPETAAVGPLVPPTRAGATMGEVLRGAGHPAEVVVDPEVDAADEAVQRTVQRVLQEATTNMLRHAPTGSRCDASVRMLEGSVVVCCANPVGSAKLDHSTGRGLRGMHERAAWLGGSVLSGTQDAGRTWVLRVELPAHAQVGVPSERAAVGA